MRIARWKNEREVDMEGGEDLRMFVFFGCGSFTLFYNYDEIHHVFISANISANDRSPWVMITSVDYNNIRCAVIQRYRLAALERECVMNPYFAVTLRYLPDRQRHKRLVLRASYSYWSKGSY